MGTVKKQNPGSVGARSGVSGVVSGWSRRPHVNPLQLFTQRLPHPARKAGEGWRARCPACDDRHGALSFTEGDEGRLLLHCFRGCPAVAILAAVGLRLADVCPFRAWPESPDEKRRARRAIREAGWASALAVLAREATVVQIAARQLTAWRFLSDDDDARLALAVERIDRARGVLCER